MYPPVFGCVSLLEEVVQAPGLHGRVVGVKGRRGEVLGWQLHPPFCRPLQDFLPSAGVCYGSPPWRSREGLVGIHPQPRFVLGHGLPPLCHERRCLFHRGMVGEVCSYVPASGRDMGHLIVVLIACVCSWLWWCIPCCLWYRIPSPLQVPSFFP